MTGGFLFTATGHSTGALQVLDFDSYLRINQVQFLNKVKLSKSTSSCKVDQMNFFIELASCSLSMKAVVFLLHAVLEYIIVDTPSVF